MREVKRKAEAGERVKVVDASSVPVTGGKPEYKNGDILTVIGIYHDSQARYAEGAADNGKARVLNPDEYVVLEGEDEMRFKVGDKVRIVNDLNKDMGNVVEDMVSIAGKTAVVEAVGGVYYKLDIDGRCWSWEDRFLELAPFTLSDLKPCMVVEYRDGELGIVAESRRGLVFNGDGWLMVDEYEDNLTAKGKAGSTFDIMRVYGFSKNEHRANEISTKGRELLFKREEPKPKRKMTVAEICKELGEEIEIVKGE